MSRLYKCGSFALCDNRIIKKEGKRCKNAPELELGD